MLIANNWGRIGCVLSEDALELRIVAHIRHPRTQEDEAGRYQAQV